MLDWAICKSVSAPVRRFKERCAMSQDELPAPFFSCAIPVRWGDMDAYGHVNNTLYFRYFEEVRFKWLEEKGIPIKGATHPVVVTIGCTFLRPLFYPENLRVDVF